MQRLKTILNTALANQALRIRLVAGCDPEWVLDGNAVQKDSAGPLSESELQQICAAVLPGQVFGSSGVIMGALNVGAQGVLKLRAKKDPDLSLDIYTTRGLELFEKDQQGALTPISIPVPQVAAPVTSPIPAIVPPAPLQASIAAPAASAPSMPFNMAPVPTPFPGHEIPQVAANTAQTFAIKSAPVGATPEVLKQETPAPASVRIPEMPSAAAQEDSSSLDQMFRVTGPSKKSPQQSAAAPKPQVPMPVHEDLASAQLPTQALGGAQIINFAAPAPSVPAKPADERIEPIDFGAKEASEGSISQGQNPIDNLLKDMVQSKASDMHLTIGQPVIFRVHGDISRTGNQQITAPMMQSFLLPTMPPRNMAEFSKVSDTDYAYELSGIGRFRVNIFRDRNGVGAVLRHIPSQILTAEQLKLPSAITKLCTLNKGLVLVTGPTGSGKSTTLAAMLDLINKTRKEHILTIEDPIEFVHPQQECLVNQREVHKHTGSFGRALKAALREDPDVVLIGEMRDLETIAIAIETAETGHLVFGTLHTTTAMSTVDRIIDQFPADRQAQIRTMLASSLRGVVTQTLLKKKGGGRVAAHEILISNDAVSAMIREGKIQHLANHMMTQKQEGNQLLNDALLKLVQDGLVDPEEAFFKSVDKNSFLASAKQRGINIAA